MKHVVSYSGGLGSWAAAMRVAQEFGTHDLILLFCDTCMEDEDLYRFLHESAKVVGGALVILREGRTPWQVFTDQRFLGNSRVDPCSRLLKREMCADWLRANCDPHETACYVGIDWTEEHRFARLRLRNPGWDYKAPLCDAPYLSKTHIRTLAECAGLEIPRLYTLGFDHNNCGGFCVKAGQAHFRHLLKVMPERYAYHERKEQAIRTELGDVSILQDRRGGITKNLTLRDFRLRIEADANDCDTQEWGGCSCFAGAPDDV